MKQSRLIQIMIEEIERTMNPSAPITARDLCFLLSFIQSAYAAYEEYRENQEDKYLSEALE